MRIVLTLTVVLASTVFASLVYCQSSDLVGQWTVEMTFSNNTKKSLSFEALDSGRGSFLFENRKSNWAEPSRPAAAKWSEGSTKTVSFSGQVLFPVGSSSNRRGTLVFRGKFEDENSLTGTVDFYNEGVDPKNDQSTPSKTGRFRALRVQKP